MICIGRGHLAWLSVALARRGSGAGAGWAGSCLAVALACTRESTSPGSPCPVSLVLLSRLPTAGRRHAPLVPSGSRPAPSASSHSQRPHHRLPPTSTPGCYSHSGRTPCRCTADTARSAPCSDRAWVPATCTPARAAERRAMGTDRPAGRYVPGRHAVALSQLHARTPPPPHDDAKYIARSLAGLHQP